MPIFHLPASTVESVVETFRCAAEVRHDIVWITPLDRVLGPDDDAAPAVPGRNLAKHGRGARLGNTKFPCPSKKPDRVEVIDIILGEFKHCRLLFAFIQAIVASLFSSTKPQHELAPENLAPRQQVMMLKRSVKRARPSTIDRLLWVAFSRNVTNWRGNLIALHPDTVVRWHREGFRRYWAWKSRPVGRPPVDAELVSLIRRMQSENVTWGAPRSHGELLKLGYDICKATVSKYMRRTRKPPSQSWRTFLSNHRDVIAAIDFFTVPTVTFDVLYVFVVVAHATRRAVHFNATAHPTAKWVAQQLTEAFPFEMAPKYLIRDGDAKYGDVVTRQITALGIDDVVTTPASPWENASAERVTGSIRRECFDRIVVLNERHLRRVLKEYLVYYHAHRTHLGLGKDAPLKREIEYRGEGNVVALPFLGGLHHRYARLAA